MKAMNVYSYNTVVLLLPNDILEIFELTPIPQLFCVLVTSILVTGVHVASTLKLTTIISHFCK